MVREELLMSMLPSHPDDLGDEHDHVLSILDEAIENQDMLTDWEVIFVDDMRERVIQYGKRTRVSERQMEIIERIHAKLNE